MSYVGFRLQQKSMTLNNLERQCALLCRQWYAACCDQTAKRAKDNHAVKYLSTMHFT